MSKLLRLLPPGPSWRRALPWLSVLLGGSLATFALFVFLDRDEAARSRSEFERGARLAVQALLCEMRGRGLQLSSVRSFFRSIRAGDCPDLAGFAEECESFGALAPADLDPRTITFFLRIPEARRTTLEASAGGGGLRGFSLRSIEGDGAGRFPGRGEDSWPNCALVPSGGLAPASSDARILGRCGEAMAAARKTRLPALTGRLPPRPDHPDGTWVALLLPLAPPGRDAPAGFVTQWISLDLLAEKALGPLGCEGFQLLVLDEKARAGERALLHYRGQGVKMPGGPSDAAATREAPGVSWTCTREVLGRSWKILVAPSPGFPNGNRAWASWLVLLCGLLFSAAASFLALVLSRRASRSEALVAERTAALNDQISERFHAVEAVNRANARLAHWVEELDRRSRQISLLGEMGAMLQTCKAVEETYVPITWFAEKLFSERSGAVYLLDPSRSHLEPVVRWGGFTGSGAGFAPEECWALRRGRAHILEEAEGELLCPHLATGERPRFPTQCVPLTAQGEALGLLHLQSLPPAKPEGDDLPGAIPHPARTTEVQQKLAAAFSESVALSLANLRLREVLREQSVRDPLTGLFNRRFMEECLEREFARARRAGSPLGIIMADIDHFKALNDASGHEAGDCVLAALGGLLRDRVRKEDIPCRYGGEEFTIVMPGIGPELTRRRAEQIQAKVRALRVSGWSGAAVSVTVSMGVAAFPEHGSDPRTVLQAADAALYRAKAEGRNRVVVAAAPA